MTSWKELIGEVLKYRKETWEDVVFCTLTEAELNVQFDDGYGGTEGKPFALWTEKCVYFPVCYDGSEWVSSISRNPVNEPKNHVGGG